MYEAALFLREYTVIENGVARLYPSVSPENTPKNLFDLPTQSATGHRCPAVQNATMDFAIMKELLTNLLDGIEITGLYIEEAPSFRELLEKIPPYFINREGAVQEWMHPNLEDNYAHRHLSHIYPVFPGMEVTAQNDPSLFEAFRKAVDLRKLGSQSNWSLTHMAGIYARFGEGEKAAECLDIMAKSVLLDSLFTIANDWRGMGITLPWGNPPVQLDAVFGTVNAIQEMIFCRQKDALSILPALPKKLHAGSVRGMVFPEGKIDIAWNIPEQVEVTVHAHRTLDTDILLAGKKMCHIHLAAGEKKTIPFR
jgi:alpha-L-fucosidase 2